MIDKFFNDTIEMFQDFPAVDAIVLGGSRALGNNDSDSDYDVYVYLNKELDIEARKKVLSKTCRYLEIDNTYWEAEDDCILKSGLCLEIIYRTINHTNQSLENTLERYNANCGYTTCICYNIFNSKVLYDPKGLYADMVRKYSFSYPEKLRQNIISKNRNLLNGKIPSYLPQIEKAIKRNDVVSINHRITEFMSSYFDILFAVNRIFHPGEKRLITLSLLLCKAIPNNFEKNITDLVSWNDKEKIILAIHTLITNLDVCINMNA